jgi:lipoprotein NlpD
VKPEARDPEALEFVWPARGKLLAGFSEPSNKGIDIAGRAGDAVVAAAAGRVIYTGSGIRGLGKLIVIRHDNNFQSVYAHNREILVKEGQTVARGQKIAELGDTDADTPKLHFEIRRSGKPVDPARYLPSG